jgi:hypothetical protein
MPKRASKKEEPSNPLVQSGEKLIPSVTRVFSKSSDMYVYAQAYEQGVPAVQPLVAFVTLYRDQSKAFETTPIQLSASMQNRLNTIPINFTIPLAQLSPGDYLCQLTLLNPASKTKLLARPIRLLP